MKNIMCSFQNGSLYKQMWKVKVAESCPTLCDSLGILQARILEWVAYPFSTESSQPRNRTRVSFIAGRFFANWAMRESPAGSREPKRQIDTAPSSPGLICRQMQNSQNANNESKVVRILKSFPSPSGMNLNLWKQTYKLIFKICFEKESLSYLLLSISFFRIPIITVIFR